MRPPESAPEQVAPRERCEFGHGPKGYSVTIQPMSSLDTIRNIAFVGHPSAGKTTLVDALAHLSGASARKGSVADKTSICDTEPEEQEKQHTLQLAAVAAHWGDRTWTFLDTPGYPEFMAEVQSAMFGADLVVGVVSCASGATFNLRSKLRMAAELGRGRAIVLTHLDGENADFDAIVDDLRERVGTTCVPVRLPNGSGAGFTEVTRTIEHPELEWCTRLKDRVMDACQDEQLLMDYMENGELTEEQLEVHMPGAIAAGALIPILVCNPESGLGVESTLNYLQRFAPSPDNLPLKDADGVDIDHTPDGHFAGTVINVKTDPHVGRVCLVRIHRGTLTPADTVHGAGRGKPEKLGGLFRLVGKKREPIEAAGPGEIAAFSKVEHLSVWDHFTSESGDPVSTPTPQVPEPMVAIAVVPKTRADEQRIGEALNKLAAEDPTFTIEHAAETHELVLHGMSDLHLHVMLDRMKRRFHVEVDTHLPTIAYQETITKAAEGHHRHRKQSGGRGQFGECYIRLRPGAAGTGVLFMDKVVGGSIPRNLIPAVEKGIQEVASTGILTNGRVIDIEVELYDGKFHAVDSDEASFKMAGNRAFKDGVSKAGPVLLEPVMIVEIHVPTDDAGTIFSDITSHRRGHVLDQANEEDGKVTVIKAEVPLSMMQTYHRDLKSQTAGEGAYSMSFARYAQVPSAEQAKILATIGKHANEED